MATRPSRSHIATLRGVGRMAVDATTGLADLVQSLHAHIAKGPLKLGGPVIEGTVNGITNMVYGGVRGTTRVVGLGIDALLKQVEPLLGAATHDAGTGLRPSRGAEALRAALNGVLGDYLAQTHNPLAIGMALRKAGVPVAITRNALQAAYAAKGGTVGKRLVVLLHGLCMSDLQWERDVLAEPSHDHGAALARDLGVTPLYVHYNSGLHISTNGHQFADLLEALVSAWPVEIEDLTLIGHSMGGLVARSAQHYGRAAAHAWPGKVRTMVFLGSPHHGAPLERGGHWIDVLLRSTGYTAPFGRLGRVRSAGITDLRHGSVLDEDWHGHDRFAHGHDTRLPLPLPANVACHAIAATTADAANVNAALRRGEKALADCADLPGDGLVPVASALGLHADDRYALAFAPSRCWVASSTSHLDLLSSTTVYRHLRACLADESGPPAREPADAQTAPLQDRAPPAG